MMFGQLSHRDSIHNLINIISAHFSKTYHIRFGKNVTSGYLAKVHDLTNDMEMPAVQVALPNKYRWHIRNKNLFMLTKINKSFLSYKQILYFLSTLYYFFIIQQKLVNWI